jgi:hypothetical protein
LKYPQENNRLGDSEWKVRVNVKEKGKKYLHGLCELL